MDKPKILKLSGFLVFLVVLQRTNSQWVPNPDALRPLCASQFALANHACAYLPYVSHPPSPSLGEQLDSHTHSHTHSHRHRHRHAHDRQYDREQEDDHEHEHEHEHEQGHRHGRRHNQHEHEHEHEQEQGHRHGRKHNEHKHEHEHEQEQGQRHGRRHRRHRREATPLEENCCRWLKAIDNECVCDLLVHLPPFLSRPVHQYTVLVRDACTLNFQCASRIKA